MIPFTPIRDPGINALLTFASQQEERRRREEEEKARKDAERDAKAQAGIKHGAVAAFTVIGASAAGAAEGGLTAIEGAQLGAQIGSSVGDIGAGFVGKNPAQIGQGVTSLVPSALSLRDARAAVADQGQLDPGQLQAIQDSNVISLPNPERAQRRQDFVFEQGVVGERQVAVDSARQQGRLNQQIGMTNEDLEGVRRELSQQSGRQISTAEARQFVATRQAEAQAEAQADAEAKQAIGELTEVRHSNKQIQDHVALGEEISQLLEAPESKMANGELAPETIEAVQGLRAKQEQIEQNPKTQIKPPKPQTMEQFMSNGRGVVSPELGIIQWLDGDDEHHTAAIHIPGKEEKAPTNQAELLADFDQNVLFHPNGQTWVRGERGGWKMENGPVSTSERLKFIQMATEQLSGFGADNNPIIPSAEEVERRAREIAEIVQRMGEPQQPTPAGISGPVAPSVPSRRSLLQGSAAPSTPSIDSSSAIQQAESFIQSIGENPGPEAREQAMQVALALKASGLTPEQMRGDPNLRTIAQRLIELLGGTP